MLAKETGHGLFTVVHQFGVAGFVGQTGNVVHVKGRAFGHGLQPGGIGQESAQHGAGMTQMVARPAPVIPGKIPRDPIVSHISQTSQVQPRRLVHGSDQQQFLRVVPQPGGGKRFQEGRHHRSERGFGQKTQGHELGHQTTGTKAVPGIGVKFTRVENVDARPKNLSCFHGNDVVFSIGVGGEGAAVVRHQVHAIVPHPVV